MIRHKKAAKAGGYYIDAPLYNYPSKKVHYAIAHPDFDQSTLAQIGTFTLEDLTTLVANHVKALSLQFAQFPDVEIRHYFSIEHGTSSYDEPCDGLYFRLCMYAERSETEKETVARLALVTKGIADQKKREKELVTKAALKKQQEIEDAKNLLTRAGFTVEKK